MENKDLIGKTVVVGMSGGVDSSVAALLLKERGATVIGLFMKNWEEEDENGVCQASKEFEDVVKVCEKINIPYYSIEFVAEYRDNVFRHFVEEYKQGYTPNPDILCNREIKFKVFYDKAMQLGADYLATGHYCQTEVINGKAQLIKGNDKNKDQSYFLYAVKGEILEKVLFPIGHLPKSEVRRIAEENGLATSTKKDSTGICFIGERNFRNFLSNYINNEPGDFKHLDGTVVGRHVGTSFYTLGQRKGLGLGGPGEPWFVVDKDIDSNTVYVERGERHPAMYTDTLTANEFDFVNPETIETIKKNLPYKLKAKVRYRQPDQDCTITEIENGQMKVVFDTPQRAITPRQSVVFYQTMANKNVCLGGAMIVAPGTSYYQLGRELPATCHPISADH